MERIEFYRVKESDLIGDLKYLPLSIAQELIFEQYYAGNNCDISQFQHHFASNKNNGGFDWGYSIKNRSWGKLNNNKENKRFCKSLENKIDDIYFDVSNYVTVDYTDCIKDLEGFTINVIEAMLSEQLRQNYFIDLNIFQNNRFARKETGGFDWSKSIHGFDFWNDILSNKDSNSSNELKYISQKYYIVEEDDLIDDLKDMPISVVQLMIDEQIRQGNKANITVFQKDKLAKENKGGFDWDKSIEGYCFWEHMIHYKKYPYSFDYLKYPIIIHGIKMLPGYFIEMENRDIYTIINVRSYTQSFSSISVRSDIDIMCINIKNGTMCSIHKIDQWKIKEIYSIERSTLHYRDIEYELRKVMLWEKDK